MISKLVSKKNFAMQRQFTGFKQILNYYPHKYINIQHIYTSNITRLRENFFLLNNKFVHKKYIKNYFFFVIFKVKKHL